VSGAKDVARRFLSGLGEQGGARVPPGGVARPSGVDGWPSDLFLDARKHDGSRAERGQAIADLDAMKAARLYLVALGKD
jgi:hypothetical protein